MLDLNAIMGPQALQNATPQHVQAVLDFYALPGMNTELFLPIIFGVLGIGGFGTWEKINGKARDNHHNTAIKPWQNYAEKISN